MPATNIEQLLDFEGNFEKAAQTILVAAGVAAYISQQATKLPLINTGLMFDVGASTDDLIQIPAPANWPTDREPPMEFCIYDGALNVQVEVPRDKNGAPMPGVDTFLAAVRSKVRNTFMMSVAPFNSTNLPLYRVSRIKPAGTSTGEDQVRNINFTILRFALRWTIVPSEFPAWY
jgi:hypothetical protein